MSKHDTLTIHRLKAGAGELARFFNGARSTVRRCDDRVFRVGDRLIFEGDGIDAGRLEATITRQPQRLAGPLSLVGADPTRIEPHLVPMALIDFQVRQTQLPLVAPDAGDVDDYRKILAIANSVGDTVDFPEALSLICSICRTHLSSVRSSS